VQHLGVCATLFAYPNGDWTPTAQQELVRLGYRVGVRFDHRIASGRLQPMQISRLRLDADAPLARVRSIVAGTHPTVFHLIRRGDAPEDSAPDRNLELFNSDDLVAAYDAGAGLTPAEQHLIARYVRPGGRMLDLGIGTGRTTAALAPMASTYLGIDYAARMVETARARYPNLDLQVGDAAELDHLPARSFDTILFSFNGLDYLHPHERRVRALHGFTRLLAPGGVLLFSSHNPRAVVRAPASPITARSSAIAGVATARAGMKLLPTRAFWGGAGYVRDVTRPLRTYFAIPSRVAAELKACGLVLVETVGSDFPRLPRAWRTPWFHYVCVAAR
jgi:SAM-dependent methyltransferase